jgi:hypothetical protein
MKRSVLFPVVPSDDFTVELLRTRKVKLGKLVTCYLCHPITSRFAIYSLEVKMLSIGDDAEDLHKATSMIPEKRSPNLGEFGSRGARGIQRRHSSIVER